MILDISYPFESIIAKSRQDTVKSDLSAFCNTQYNKE